MEATAAAGLGLGTLLVIVAIMAYYGVFSTIETGVKMADAELTKLADEQVARHNSWYNENELDLDAAIKAAEQRAYYRALREGKAPTQKAKA